MVESRPAEDGAAVRRRRECGSCGHRFTSFERIAPSAAIVRKRDGRRQEFDPAKLRAGLARAAHKLPEAEAAIAAIAASVELEAAAAAGSELSSKRIGELCLRGLREADTIAYLRFATVHKQLADTEAIRAELRALDVAEAMEAEPALARLVSERRWPAPSATSAAAPGPERANHENFAPREGQDETVHAQDLDANDTGRQIHA